MNNLRVKSTLIYARECLCVGYRGQVFADLKSGSVGNKVDVLYTPAAEPQLYGVRIWLKAYVF
jgi:hypothetical protein